MLKFAAGELCMMTGVFRVYHFDHRFPHDVLVLVGESFPECKICRKLVRFERILASDADNPVDHYISDKDLSIL